VAVYAFQSQQAYLGIMFAALAYDSFQTYQNTRGWR
jgi:hypothetical protein